MIEALQPRDPALTGFALDGTVKGVPPGARLTLAGIGAAGWNVLRGELPLPLAVIRQEPLLRNARWMAEFAAANGLSLCPHGKTTMAPQLWSLQLAEGAWGITVATLQQLEVARRFGVKRVIWANQPVGRLSVDACFAALAGDPGFELFVLADSLAVVEGLAEGAARAGLSRPLPVLLEVGTKGGRTGARGQETALAVARAIAAAPGLALAGVEAFEGLLPDSAAVDAFLELLTGTARACAAEELFGLPEILLTAGGSVFFDRVAPRLAAAGELGRPVRRVLRSGCYLTHDVLGYAEAQARIRRESAGSLRFPEGELEAALEVWAMVQSIPEPGRAILTCGRRDISSDAGWPVPLRRFRPGWEAPRPMGPFHKVTGMNDQHAYLLGPDDGMLAVGDLVALGPGHPCTTFDKWQAIPLVDEACSVVGAIRTFF
jgi:D-serine dehydratase